MFTSKWKAGVFTGAMLTVVLLVSGCSAGSSGSTVDTGGYTLEDKRMADSAEAPNVVEGAGAVTSEEFSQEGVEKDRAVISTGRLSLIADDPVAVSTEIQNTVSDVDGRVDSVTENPATEYSTASASLIVRVPSEDFKPVVEELKETGTVEEYVNNSTDVTDTLKDYDVRIESLRTSIDRLLVLMSEATDTNALLAIETTLSQRQTELESLLASQANLQDEVAFSTVEVHIQAPEDAAAPEPGTFYDGLVNGWEALTATATGLLIAFGFLLPWLLVVGVIAGVVWFVIRRKRKKVGVTAPVVVVEQPEPVEDPVEPETK